MIKKFTIFLFSILGLLIGQAFEGMTIFSPAQGGGGGGGTFFLI